MSENLREKMRLFPEINWSTDGLSEEEFQKLSQEVKKRVWEKLKIEITNFVAK